MSGWIPSSVGFSLSSHSLSPAPCGLHTQTSHKIAGFDTGFDTKTPQIRLKVATIIVRLPTTTDDLLASTVSLKHHLLPQEVGPFSFEGKGNSEVAD